MKMTNALQSPIGISTSNQTYDFPISNEMRSMIYRMNNYTDILRHFNVTEEDLDYVNNFHFDTNEEISGKTGVAATTTIMTTCTTTTTTTTTESTASPTVEMIYHRHYHHYQRDHYDKTYPQSCYCNNGTVRDLALIYKSTYHVYVALVVCFFGTIANVLNIIVLTRKDMVNAPINRILTGLAIADMLVMIEYVPFAVYEYLILPQKQMFPYGSAVFVLFHMHFTQLFHTISIALTLSLAIWRFIAIKFPQNQAWYAPDRCKIALWTSVLVPFVACIPSYFVFGIKEQKIYENCQEEILYHVDSHYKEEKVFLYRLNFWILGVVVKLLPCVILTIISCWLIKALYKTKRRRLRLRNYNRGSEGIVMSTLTNKTTTTTTTTTTTPDENDPSNNFQGVAKCERRTDRTTRMLVAVLLLFLITEIPQGILGLLSGVLGDCFFRSCYHNFGEIMDIFALLNGAINFILYCSMSRQFRTTFGQLFKPRILRILQHADLQSTMV